MIKLRLCGATYLEQGKYNTLEERCRFVKRSLHGFVIVHVELPVVLVPALPFLRQANILLYRVEQYAFEEDAGLRGFHLRDEYSCGGMARLWRPVLRLGKRKHAGPRGERGDNFEWFWEWSGLVSRENDANSIVRTRLAEASSNAKTVRTLCTSLPPWDSGRQPGRERHRDLSDGISACGNMELAFVPR